MLLLYAFMDPCWVNLMNNLLLFSLSYLFLYKHAILLPPPSQFLVQEFFYCLWYIKYGYRVYNLIHLP